MEQKLKEILEKMDVLFEKRKKETKGLSVEDLKEMQVKKMIKYEAMYHTKQKLKDAILKLESKGIVADEITRKDLMKESGLYIKKELGFIDSYLHPEGEWENIWFEGEYHLMRINEYSREQCAIDFNLK